MIKKITRYAHNFKIAIISILRHEGGFSDVKEDRGGATNYGISTRFLKLIGKDLNGDGHVNEKDILSITKETAIELYYKYFWSHYKLDSIRDVKIATKCFDMFVNMRGKSAGKIIQKSCNALGYKLKEDGICGVLTFSAINRLSSNIADHGLLMNELREHQAMHYEAIVKADKSQSKFLNGWLNRARS